jgi:hypothetical protein
VKLCHINLVGPVSETLSRYERLFPVPSIAIRSFAQTFGG